MFTIIVVACFLLDFVTHTHPQTHVLNSLKPFILESPIPHHLDRPHVLMGEKAFDKKISKIRWT